MTMDLQEQDMAAMLVNLMNAKQARQTQDEEKAFDSLIQSIYIMEPRIKKYLLTLETLGINLDAARLVFGEKLARLWTFDEKFTQPLEGKVLPTYLNEYTPLFIASATPAAFKNNGGVLVVRLDKNHNVDYQYCDNQMNCSELELKKDSYYMPKMEPVLRQFVNRFPSLEQETSALLREKLQIEQAKADDPTENPHFVKDSLLALQGLSFGRSEMQVKKDLKVYGNETNPSEKYLKAVLKVAKLHSKEHALGGSR